jgi:TadE-like protein
MALRFRPDRRLQMNGKDATDGQSLVEFALVFPAFVLILFSVIEFAMVLNAMLGVNFASREAALTAAEAGNNAGADCAILRTIDKSFDAPADKRRITSIEIYLSQADGRPVQPERKIVYVRGGNLSCPLPDGTPATLPYSYSFGSYAYNTRCNVLAGCGTRTVDTIGVEINYVYDWKTPMASLLPSAGDGYTFHMGNAMRMEPVL